MQSRAENIALCKKWLRFFNEIEDRATYKVTPQDEIMAYLDGYKLHRIDVVSKPAQDGKPEQVVVIFPDYLEAGEVSFNAE